MSDILIRNVPDRVVAAIDSKAMRVGLSRSEYLRRALERESSVGSGPVTRDHLAGLAELAADLNDAEVMRTAWS